MSRICPQCSQVNPDSIAYCTRCGYRFQGGEQIVEDDATARPASLSGLPADADPGSTLKSQPPQVPQSTPSEPPPQESKPVPTGPLAQQAPQAAPAVAPPPVQPAGGYFSPNPPNQSQSGYPSVPLQPQGAYMAQQGYGQPPYAMPPMAMQNTNDGLSSLKRAFAGKGTPVHHQSWLLDGKQVQPATLRNLLVENIQRQGVMGLTATQERLRERGVIMEDRDFVKIQYGISSLFVYMAPMGQSLYISRTSTVQQPFSRIRQFVLLGLLILLLLSLLFYALINPSLNIYDIGAYGFASNIKQFFFYLFFGLLFFFLYLLVRSLVFWLTDGDFLAYLRPNRLNDFTFDALCSIEQITDKAIRETVRQAGLNPAEVTIAAQGYPLSQSLHRI